MLAARQCRAITIVSTEQTSHRSSSPGASAGSGLAWRRVIPSWPLVIGLVGLLRALAEPRALLHDPDTYLHIAAGRWMLAHWALPTADPFSHSLAGAPWVPGEWLGELLLAGVYDVAGWGGVIALTAGCFAVGLAILTRFLLRRVEPLPALIAALAGAALVLPHLLARPHILALPLLVAWCGALLAARDDGRLPPWAALPVMALWANVHGSFMFGLGLAVFLAAEAAVSANPPGSRWMQARNWGAFVLAALAASLLTPNGVSAIVQPFRLLAMPALQAGFAEWMPANLGEFPALEAWLFGALALGFLGRVRVPLPRLVLLLGLVHMALSHVRHADLLGLVGPLAVAGAVGPALAALARPAAGSPLMRGAAVLAAPARLPGWALTLALAVAVAIPVLLSPPARDGDPVTPAAALAASRHLGLTGPVFNSEAFGGYFIFAGIPPVIDGRIEMYGNQFLAEYLAAERGDKTALIRIIDRYHIEWSMLSPQSGAVAAIERLPDWRRAYADGQAVVDVRVDSAAR